MNHFLSKVIWETAKDSGSQTVAGSCSSLSLSEVTFQFVLCVIISVPNGGSVS